MGFLQQFELLPFLFSKYLYLLDTYLNLPLHPMINESVMNSKVVPCFVGF